MNTVSRSARALAALCCLTLASICCAQGTQVSGTVVQEPASDASNTATVVWLTPVGVAPNSTTPMPMHAVLTQKNKAFEPHLLVITRGSTVDFPNRDPWFHNVFSQFNGKRFDLGLYEAGTSKIVHFDREGVSFIFCNIHPEMSAVIVVLGSTYFSTTNKQGEFTIEGVEPGRYILHVWNENTQPATLQALSHEVQVGDSTKSIGTIRLPVTRSTTMHHKNKYGQDYEPPSPNNPVYVQP